ncbi:MAG: hypothetical protein GX781_07320, partial [Clostridiales bacterium]|nr:hypothetical protein [Clostridiales bacterium]
IWPEGPCQSIGEAVIGLPRQEPSPFASAAYPRHRTSVKNIPVYFYHIPHPAVKMQLPIICGLPA